jgi:hypothetical protein
MAILFKHDDAGGFLAGDTVTGRCAYAYPTSDLATQARRRPDAIAINMVRQENACWTRTDTPIGREIAARDARWLDELRRTAPLGHVEEMDQQADKAKVLARAAARRGRADSAGNLAAMSRALRCTLARWLTRQAARAAKHGPSGS